MAEPERPKKKKKKAPAREPAEAPAAEPAEAAADSSPSRVDEAAIGRAIAIGLPLVTLTLAAAGGVMVNVGVAILVLASGFMLAAIAMLWGSLRVLSGEAPLPAGLAEIEATKQRSDPLAGRRDMLLRALKDLEVERSIGKLDDADFLDVSERYRNDLKAVMVEMDAAVAPHMRAAEKALHRHFEQVGLIEAAYRGRTSGASRAAQDTGASDDDASEPALAEAASGDASQDDDDDDLSPVVSKVESTDRAICAKCETSNETDAAFCKKCGAAMTTEGADA